MYCSGSVGTSQLLGIVLPVEQVNYQSQGRADHPLSLLSPNVGTPNAQPGARAIPQQYVIITCPENTWGLGGTYN